MANQKDHRTESSRSDCDAANSYSTKRRSALKGIVGAAIGVSGIGTVNAKRGPKDESEEVLSVYNDWLDQHGEVLDTESSILNENAGRYMQTLAFSDGTRKEIIVHLLSDTEAWVRVEGTRYFTRGEPLTREERRERRDGLPEFGGGKESNTFTLSRGESLSRTSATRYEYVSSGIGLGTKLTRHNLSQFRGESYVSIAGAGWSARSTDLFVDVQIQEPTTRTVTIEAGFDLRWAFALMALGGRARALGQAVIYDLDTETPLATADAYEQNRRLLDLRSWSGSAQPLLAAQNVRGGKTLRIGIRAISEAEAWLTAWATADTYTAEGNDRFHRTRSLNVSVR